MRDLPGPGAPKDLVAFLRKRMNSEHIATIQEFLTRAELHLNRYGEVFKITSIDDHGHVVAIRQTNRRRVEINLADKEIASLAAVCFPPPK